MKTIFFLGMGLLVTAIGFGQTTAYYPANYPDALNNVIVGLDAGNISTTATGSENVFVGYRAGENNTIGAQNVFLGLQSGNSNTEGNNNVFIGQLSGNDNIGGIQNVSIGLFAGRENVSGNHNVNIGSNAGRDNINSGNVFLGAFSGQQNTGTGNVFNGMYTGTLSGSGANNTYIGYLAGNKSTGSNNIFLGRSTGSGTGATSLTGNGNVLIGNNVGKNLTSESNQLYIDNSDRDNPLIYGNFATGTRELKFNAKKVGIGFEGTTGNEGFGDFPALTGLSNADKYRLFVRGGILAEEVRIRLHEDWIWPDYVFAKDYKLLSLKDTEKYIVENGHLPNMPSAQQVKEEGLEFGNIARLQQEKIEELTLHLIEQQKQIEELKAQVQLLLNK